MNLKTNAKRTCVLVAGMHRSGTSATTRVLNLLGCAGPRETWDPDESNISGYWEPARIVELTDQILDSIGSSWDDWAAIPDDWFSTPAADALKQQAAEIFQAEYRDERLIVMKDPRICRLMPFWIEVLDSLDVRPVVVSPIRNPLEVARSLAARDASDMQYNRLLWLRHAIEAERGSRGIPRFHFAYDDLLENWSAVTSRAGKALGLVWPKRSARVARTIDDFVRVKNRHHTVRPSALLDDDAESEWVRTTFAILLKWSRDGEDATDFAVLDRIRTELNQAERAMSGFVLAGRTAMSSAASLATETEHLRSQVAETTARIGALEASLEASQSESASLAAQVTALTGEVQSLSEQKALIESARDALSEKIVELGRDAALKSAALEVRISELEAAEQVSAEEARHAAEVSRRLEETEQARAEGARYALELQSQLEEAVKARAEEAQIASEVRHQLEEAEQARAEGARYALELQSQLEEAVKARAEEAQIASEVRRQLEEAEQARAEGARYALELQSQLEEAVKARAEEAQIASEVRRQLEEAEQARAEGARYALELQSQLEEAVKARAEEAQIASEVRRQLEETEQARAEGARYALELQSQLEEAAKARAEEAQIASEVRRQLEETEQARAEGARYALELQSQLEEAVKARAEEAQIASEVRRQLEETERARSVAQEHVTEVLRQLAEAEQAHTLADQQAAKERRELEERLESTQAELDAAAAQRDAALTHLAAAEAARAADEASAATALAALREAYAASEEKLADLTQALKIEREQHKALASELSAMEADRAVILQRADMLSSQVEQMANDLKVQREDAAAELSSRIDAERAKADERTAQLVQHIDLLVRETREIKQVADLEKAAALKQYQELETSMSAALADAAALQSEVRTLLETVRVLEGDLAESTSEVQLRSQEAEDTRKELQRLADQLEAEREAALKDTTALVSQIDQLSRDLQSQRESAAAELVSQVQAERAKADATIAKLVQHVQVLVRETRELKQSAEREQAAVTEQYREVEASLIASRSEAGALRSEVLDLMDMVQSLEVKLAETTSALRQRSAEAEDTHQELQRVVAQLEAEQQQRHLADQTVTGLQGQLRLLVSDVELRDRELELKLGEVRSLRAELQLLQQTSDEMMIRLRGQVDGLVRGVLSDKPRLFQRRSRAQLRKAALLQEAGLFNAEAYLRANPDVAQAGVEPGLHYVNSGWLEGRRLTD